MTYPAKEVSSRFSGKKITKETFNASVAIIDDLESNRSFLEHLARRMPDVKHVASYPSAIEALAAFEDAAPDVVITDFNMPGMNGVEFLEEFRAQPDFQDIPVIVISSQNESENRHRALVAGATDFLMVPFDTFEFQARARNLLRLSLHQKSLKSLSLSLRSELVETRHRSLETQHRFTRIIDSVPALVFALDSGRHCVFANTYCFDLLGLDPEAGLGQLQFLAEKVSDGKGEGACSAFPPSQEITLLSSDGQNHIFLIAPKAIGKAEPGGELFVYSGIEITRLKQIEHSLRSAKDDAEAANRAKSAFLSNMTHEIRTPLNAIMGFTDVICNELHGPIGNAVYKNYLYDIQSSARHLLAVVNEILDFSQIEAQRCPVNSTVFSLCECLDDVMSLMKSQLTKRGNTLNLNSLPAIELRTDRQKLNQVLLNILANANHASQNGVIRLSVENVERKGLALCIEDHGVGMDDDELALALTEFGRAMTSAFISNAQPGAGLGLPISIRLMTLLGGDLWIESRKGEGTTVRILLPGASLVEADVAEQLTGRTSKDAVPSGNRVCPI